MFPTKIGQMTSQSEQSAFDIVSRSLLGSIDRLPQRPDETPCLPSIVLHVLISVEPPHRDQLPIAFVLPH